MSTTNICAPYLQTLVDRLVCGYADVILDVVCSLYLGELDAYAVVPVMVDENQTHGWPPPGPRTDIFRDVLSAMRPGQLFWLRSLAFVSHDITREALL